MEKRTLITNSLSLLVTRLIQSIATFVLTAAIARNLGAYELGQYLLAFSYYFVFASIASQGLKTLFTRELSRNPEEIPVYLVNGTFLQMLLSVLGYGAMIILVFLLPYNPDTSMVCYIMGLAIIPFSLSNITEAIFQAQEKMTLIAASTVPVYILRLVVMIWCIQELNYGVNYIAGIFVVSEVIVFIIQWVMLTSMIKPRWEIKQDFIRQLLKSARTFFAIDAVGIITSKTSILIISLLGSEVMVGLFGAVVQLMQPISMIIQSVSLAAFPGMTKAVNSGKKKQAQVAENIVTMLMCIALPFVIGIYFIGNDLIRFIYQNSDFNQIELVLQLTVLSVLASPFIRTLGYLLLSNGLEKYNLKEVLITNTVGNVAGVVLISQFQLMGAAFMYLSMSLTAFTILMYGVYSRLFVLNLWRIMYRPLLIGGSMTLVFLLLQRYQINFVLVLILSTSAYALIASFLAVNTLGGVNVLRAKIFKKSERET
ncbi:oligosaccharide flippase family protein [Nostoc sp. CCY0012]|uniref:oligosaccharide flippase family protein n=1 Tax=Nostoc sp. CCY0012 TaxID=1056123 RepID=UPI0039C64ADA